MKNAKSKQSVDSKTLDDIQALEFAHVLHKCGISDLIVLLLLIFTFLAAGVTTYKSWYLSKTEAGWILYCFFIGLGMDLFVLRPISILCTAINMPKFQINVSLASIEANDAAVNQASAQEPPQRMGSMIQKEEHFTVGVEEIYIDEKRFKDMKYTEQYFEWLDGQNLNGFQEIKNVAADGTTKEDGAITRDDSKLEKNTLFHGNPVSTGKSGFISFFETSPS